MSDEWIARVQLRHLADSYCHAIDRRDWALLRTLYHDDAIDDHGAMFRGSPDAFVAWLPGMMAAWRATSHTITNALYLVDGDRAEGELCTTAWHLTADGTREVIVQGRYLDRYECRAGAWKFLHRSLVLDHAEERTNAAGGASGADDGVEFGCAGADDPVYARLAMFAARRAGKL